MLFLHLTRHSIIIIKLNWATKSFHYIVRAIIYIFSTYYEYMLYLDILWNMPKIQKKENKFSTSLYMNRKSFFLLFFAVPNAHIMFLISYLRILAVFRSIFLCCYYSVLLFPSFSLSVWLHPLISTLIPSYLIIIQYVSVSLYMLYNNIFLSRYMMFASIKKKEEEEQLCFDLYDYYQAYWKIHTTHSIHLNWILCIRRNYIF